MRLHFLTDSVQRALGTMLMRDLKEDVLAFIYPTSAVRTYHTFFCPPLRIVAMNAKGEILFEEVISKWRFVKLPACQYVIETSPKVNYRPFIPTILKVAPDLPQTGALDASLRMDSLLFALLAEAVSDIRRLRETHRGEVRPEIQRKKFEVWERGQIVSSAGFLLDFSRAWNLPDGAVRLSHAVLEAEEPYLEELVGLPPWPVFPGDTSSLMTACVVENPAPGDQSFKRVPRHRWNRLGATNGRRTPCRSAIIARRRLNSCAVRTCKSIWLGDCGDRASRPSGNGIKHRSKTVYRIGTRALIPCGRQSSVVRHGKRAAVRCNMPSRARRMGSCVVSNTRLQCDASCSINVSVGDSRARPTCRDC